MKKTAQALENLLQGYKDLKQNSIPKSLVEEKIEEIENRNYNDYTREQDGNEVKYSILKEFKELLKGGK